MNSETEGRKINRSTLFETTFHQVGGTSKAVAQIHVPYKRFAWMKEAKEYAEVWECSFSVDIDGVKTDMAITGEHSLQAINLAATKIAARLEEGNKEWETSDGLPLWLIFSRQVPIAWGKEFYERICSMIDREEKDFQAQIEARNS